MRLIISNTSREREKYKTEKERQKRKTKSVGCDRLSRLMPVSFGMWRSAIFDFFRSLTSGEFIASDNQARVVVAEHRRLIK